MTVSAKWMARPDAHAGSGRRLRLLALTRVARSVTDVGRLGQGAVHEQSLRWMSVAESAAPPRGRAARKGMNPLVSSDRPNRSFTFHATESMPVPPGSVVHVPILAFGVESPLTAVSVAVHVHHRAMEMLSLALVSPDLQIVLLSAFQGGMAPSFGESAARPLVFTDEAAAGISRALFPPLVGAYRPVGKLAMFRGLPPSVANGVWHLVVMDVGRSGASALVVSAALVLRT